jgi:hypothetical protein
MDERSVIGEHRERVAAYAAALGDIAALQVHGEHVLVAACLGALGRLRVADHIDGSRGIEEIAAVAGIDAEALGRVVRFLEGHGVFEVVDGRVALTGKGRLLRSDSPIWSSLALRGANDAARHLDHSLKTGEAAFGRAFGPDFWSHLGGHPDEGEAFADAMRMQSAMFAVACVGSMGEDDCGRRRGNGGSAGGDSRSERGHARRPD